MFNKQWLLASRKKVAYIVGVVAIAVAVLNACSSGAPSDVLKNAIVSQHPAASPSAGAYGHTLDSYNITNHYTKEVDNETVYVYEYKAEYLPVTHATGPAAIRSVTVTGEIDLAKRGHEWYLVGGATPNEQFHVGVKE